LIDQLRQRAETRVRLKAEGQKMLARLRQRRAQAAGPVLKAPPLSGQNGHAKGKPQT